MDEAPDSVEKMSTLAGLNNFTVSWDAAKDERVNYYNFILFKDTTFDKIDLKG